VPSFNLKLSDTCRWLSGRSGTSWGTSGKMLDRTARLKPGRMLGGAVTERGAQPGSPAPERG